MQLNNKGVIGVPVNWYLLFNANEKDWRVWQRINAKWKKICINKFMVTPYVMVQLTLGEWTKQNLKSIYFSFVTHSIIEFNWTFLHCPRTIKSHISLRFNSIKSNIIAQRMKAKNVVYLRHFLLSLSYHPPLHYFN